MNNRFFLTLVFPSFLACSLIGCVVGPDYAGPPQVPINSSFARAGDSFDQNPSYSGEIQWWSSLNDPALDRLVQRALEESPDIAVVKARVRQARASLRGEEADLLPSADASLAAAHVHLPTKHGGGLDATDASSASSAGAGSLPSSINLFNAGFDASWELDLFGGQRRAIESAKATAEATDEHLVDAQLSLVAEVAQAYVNLRSTQARLGLSNRAIERQQQQIALTSHSFEGGTASEVDVIRLENQLETTRSQTEPLVTQVELYLNELAVLTGAAPGTLDATLATPDNAIPPIPLPPASLTVTDPATLLRQRPDIRAAERTLASRQAQIGQATAARFPSLSLFGIIGIGGTHGHDLTHLDDFTAVAAPRLNWNVLDFGRVSANIQQAESARDEAEAQYQSTVLSALRDAEDSLARFSQGRVSVATLARNKKQADRAATLMTLRQQGGTATLIDVLDTERQQLTAEQNLAQAEGSLTNNFIALHKALGIGLVKSIEYVQH